MHLKLSSVISDIHGVSGRDMLRAVIAGERDPRVLAEMARGRIRRRTAALEEALDCSFLTPEHVFVLEMMLDAIDRFTAQIAVLDERIAVLCEPYERQIARLDAIPGFGVTTAQDPIAETGANMSAFPTAGHLCSWARLTPRVTESAGKRKGRNATGRGNPYASAALGESAAGAARTRTFLAAKYQRLCRRMPKRKAQVAIMRTQLAIAHAILSDPQAEYQDLGPATTSSKPAPGASPTATSAASRTSAGRSPSSPSTPTPGNSPTRPANPPQPGSRRHKPPPAAAACPPEVRFSGQSLMALRAAVAA